MSSSESSNLMSPPSLLSLSLRNNRCSFCFGKALGAFAGFFICGGPLDSGLIRDGGLAKSWAGG